MIKYRVAIKVGYSEAWFEFEDSATACEFAETALNHSMDLGDDKKQTHIDLSIVNIDKESEEK